MDKDRCSFHISRPGSRSERHYSRSFFLRKFANIDQDNQLIQNKDVNYIIYLDLLTPQKLKPQIDIKQSNKQFFPLSLMHFRLLWQDRVFYTAIPVVLHGKYVIGLLSGKYSGKQQQHVDMKSGCCSKSLGISADGGFNLEIVLYRFIAAGKVLLSFSNSQSSRQKYGSQLFSFVKNLL